MTTIRVLFVLALLLLSCPFLQVTRSQSESETEVGEAAEEGGELGIVGDDVQDYSGGSFSPAPGVETVCVFPQNPKKLVVAGEATELLVGLKHEGESNLNVIAVQASVHLPYDRNLLVQNLSSQAFNNASVPPSAQATFPYIFAVSKFLQAGTFDLVGTIVYEIEQQPYQSTFYNGTIEVTEAGGPLSVESVFLFSLGVALLFLLGLWVRTQITQFSKKTKRAPKVEVGTATTDASMDEWLESLDEVQSYILVKRSNEGNTPASDHIVHMPPHLVMLQYYIERQCLLKCTRQILMHALYVGTGEKEVQAIRDETEKLIVDGLENKLLSVLQDLLSSTYPENMVIVRICY